MQATGALGSCGGSPRAVVLGSGNPRRIPGDDRKKLLDALSSAIATPEQSGGALCHFSIHGVRIYRGKELFYEGTFCWFCKNFSFGYPSSASWLEMAVRKG